jgi:hypothetical protein
MPKEFYTEKDIEDLFQRGIRSLQVNENVVLTELAYEQANRLGLQLISDRADNPPAAPVRPYLSEPPTRQIAHAKPVIAPVAAPVTQPKPALSAPQARGEKGSDIEKRIRSAVVAKLGDQVDAKLLDNIIHRVVKGIGLK